MKFPIRIPRAITRERPLPNGGVYFEATNPWAGWSWTTLPAGSYTPPGLTFAGTLKGWRGPVTDDRDYPITTSSEHTITLRRIGDTEEQP